MTASGGSRQEKRRTVTLACLLVGAGMAGFADGIVLHQILQWHSMISGWMPPASMLAMRENMLWDGIFHAGMWTVVAGGVALLWSAVRGGASLPAGTPFLGLLLLGAGGFNTLEGVIDHQLLGIHHVRDGPNPLPLDLAFLLLGGMFPFVVGWRMSRAWRNGTGATRPGP